MTAQTRERLIYKGEETSMATEPLSQYLETRNDIKFNAPNTACWRGYYGKWEIKDNKLFLIELTAYIEDFNEVDLKYVFPERTEVFAHWFSDKIRIPRGKMLDYIHGGYNSTYEKDLILEFNNGILLSEIEIDNLEKFQKLQIEREKAEIEREKRQPTYNSEEGIKKLRELSKMYRENRHPNEIKEFLKKANEKPIKKSFWEKLFGKSAKSSAKNNLMYFYQMGGAGNIRCNDCNFNQDIVSFLHGFGENSWNNSGFQCQDCGKFHKIEYDIKNSNGKICECGGKLEKEKPLFCPECKSNNLSYRMSFIT